MRFLTTTLLAIAMLLGPAATATATSTSSVTATPSGFETTYWFEISGTLNGNDATSVMILEAGAGNEVSRHFPFVAATGSTSILSHEIDFYPTSALIVGLELPSPNVGDGKTHIVMGVNEGFAADSIGSRFSQAFPNSRHSLFIANYVAAVNGDADALQELEDFFLTGDGAAASFTPGEPFRYIISSVIVPEPASLALWAGALGVIAFSGRRRE